MPRGNGFTRRGIFGAGAAGAVAAGMSACGDDYFEPATSHGKDVPNVVLIFTDSTRADFIGHYNKHFGYGNRLADTPNLDALGRDSLAFEMAVPEAMPTGPARRGLLTGVRSFPFRNYVPTPGLPVGPGWISIQDNQPIITEVLGEAGVETGYCTDNPFLIGPRFANFRSTVDKIKPSFSQGAYRFLNKPFKRPAPRSAIERYLLPELSDSVEVGRLRSMVGWNSIYRDTDADYPAARVFRSAINIVDDLKRKRPFFLGADGFDPHEPLDAPKIFQDKYGGPKGIEVTKGITPIQPFETPYSWVIDMKLDPETIERVRELYAGEIAFTDQWIGRLMNRLADQNLLDETVVIYSSDHGLTLGEQGVVGKHGARAQWHIYHVPFFIRHPEGKLAGQWDPFYASNHDIAKTAMSFMGVRPPGMMTGEDLSVIFDGKRPPPRPHFTSCYDDYVLAGDDEWFFLTDSARFRPQLYDQKKDPRQEHNIADQHPDLVEKYWRILSDEAGGTLPQFSRHGAKPVLGG